MKEFWEGEKNEKDWGSIVYLKWNALFVRYGVDLVVSGHSHVYQRGRRSGVTYVIAGGGGGMTYWTHAYSGHTARTSTILLVAWRHTSVLVFLHRRLGAEGVGEGGRLGRV